MMRQVNVSIGSDPELFVSKGGQVIGSERVIPEEGLKSAFAGPLVVRDGIQIELHPTPSCYIIYALASLQQSFTLLRNTLVGTDMKADFRAVIEVSKQELLSLSPASQVLGCKPSFNYYGMPPIAVDPLRYRKRSAGGHVHLGLPATLLPHRLRLVPIHDVILGNTCVLIDRDPNQKERRKLYGRPGEYRMPDHGMEYRYLSNFWLRSPVLADFVLSMSKTCAKILETTVQGVGNLEHELLSKVNFKNMVRGMSDNDSKVAEETFKVVKEFLLHHGDKQDPLHYGMGAKFDRFLKLVQKDGLENVFPQDPVEAWCTWKGNDGEWLRFLDRM